MLKSLKVTEELRTKLKRLKGYLIEDSINDTLERVLRHAGYNDSFFTKLDAMMEKRNENEVIS